MVGASPVKWPGATDKRKWEEWLSNCTRQVKRGAARRRDEIEHVRGCHTVCDSGKRKGVVKFTRNKKRHHQHHSSGSDSKPMQLAGKKKAKE